MKQFSFKNDIKIKSCMQTKFNFLQPTVNTKYSFIYFNYEIYKLCGDQNEFNYDYKTINLVQVFFVFNWNLNVTILYR